MTAHLATGSMRRDKGTRLLTRRFDLEGTQVFHDLGA
jgi:hypothetical protein